MTKFSIFGAPKIWRCLGLRRSRQRNSINLYTAAMDSRKLPEYDGMRSAYMSHVIFVHGMFLNPKYWDNWIPFFEERGYDCAAPAWPMHEGEPSDLRAMPHPHLGKLRLARAVDEFAKAAAAYREKPILIGHSLGGLIVQILVARGLARAGICISSVAPNRMATLRPGFVKNLLSVTNPFKGDAPYIMTEARFRKAFCNTMSVSRANEAYRNFAVHESRHLLRDAFGWIGRIDVEQPHAPLLFLAGSRDAIIPPALNKKNARTYSYSGSICEFKEFPGRGHFICGEPRWEEVADYCTHWLATQPWWQTSEPQPVGRL